MQRDAKAPLGGRKQRFISSASAVCCSHFRDAATENAGRGIAAVSAAALGHANDVLSCSIARWALWRVLVRHLPFVMMAVRNRLRETPCTPADRVISGFSAMRKLGTENGVIVVGHVAIDAPGISR